MTRIWTETGFAAQDVWLEETEELKVAEARKRFCRWTPLSLRLKRAMPSISAW